MERGHNVNPARRTKNNLSVSCVPVVYRPTHRAYRTRVAAALLAMTLSKLGIVELSTEAAQPQSRTATQLAHVHTCTRAHTCTQATLTVLRRPPSTQTLCPLPSEPPCTHLPCHPVVKFVEWQSTEEGRKRRGGREGEVGSGSVRGCTSRGTEA